MPENQKEPEHAPSQGNVEEGPNSNSNQEGKNPEKDLNQSPFPPVITYTINQTERTEDEMSILLESYSDEQFEKDLTFFLALVKKGLNDVKNTIYSVLAENRFNDKTSFDLELFCKKMSEQGDFEGNIILDSLAEVSGRKQLRFLRENWEVVQNFLDKVIVIYKQIAALKAKIKAAEILAELQEEGKKKWEAAIPELAKDMVSVSVEQLLVSNPEGAVSEVSVQTNIFTDEYVQHRMSEVEGMKKEILKHEEDINRDELEIRHLLVGGNEPFSASKKALNAIEEAEENIK